MDLHSRIEKYFAPPGGGVHTVHTAREHKHKLYQELYETVDSEEVTNKWLKSLEGLEDETRPCLFGICLDTGGGIQRGANWGPLFIRTVLDQKKYFDLGDTKVIPHLLHDKYLNQETISSCQEALYLEKTDLPVSALSIAEDFCHHFYDKFPNKTLIALGGDHSVSYPLVKTWLEKSNAQNKRVGIIHFDAHTDLMDKRLGIDICFASWAYHMIPLLKKPTDLIQLGIRSSGQDRSYWENKLGVTQHWADALNKDWKSVTEGVIEYIKLEGIEEVYLSFDIDALDSNIANATGTPESGGLSLETALGIIRTIQPEVKITGADLVEVAPFVNNSPTEPNSTLDCSKKLLEQIISGM